MTQLKLFAAQLQTRLQEMMIWRTQGLRPSGTILSPQLAANEFEVARG